MSDYIFIVSLIILLPATTVTMYNLITGPTVRRKNVSDEYIGKISVLIPARNEEKNIGDILELVCKQEYTDLEILVLDDHSTDKTPDIVSDFINKDKRVKLIEGEKLPNGWLGKNWACYQLSKAANGEYFLFIDADVKLVESSINSIVYFRKKFKDFAMLSVFPTQIYRSLGEKLLVPLMNWILLSFLPLRYVFTKKNKSFIAANGQLIFIERKSYDYIGGHEAVKNKVVEDMEIGRLIKCNGKKLVTAVGGDSIYCKMYDGFRSAYNGFSKNFFSGFNTSAFAFILMLIVIEIGFLLPISGFLFNAKFLGLILLIILNRTFVSFISGQNFLLNLVLHPIQMVLLFVVGINSVIKFKAGKIEWKGRKI